MSYLLVGLVSLVASGHAFVQLDSISASPDCSTSPPFDTELIAYDLDACHQVATGNGTVVSEWETVKGNNFVVTTYSDLNCTTTKSESVLPLDGSCAPYTGPTTQFLNGSTTTYVMASEKNQTISSKTPSTVNRTLTMVVTYSSNCSVDPTTSYTIALSFPAGGCVSLEDMVDVTLSDLISQLSNYSKTASIAVASKMDIQNGMLIENDFSDKGCKTYAYKAFASAISLGECLGPLNLVHGTPPAYFKFCCDGGEGCGDNENSNSQCLNPMTTDKGGVTGQDSTSAAPRAGMVNAAFGATLVLAAYFAL